MLMVRMASSAFVALALVVFKPFGLGGWHWPVAVHLLVFWVLGVLVCLFTDALLSLVLRFPFSPLGTPMPALFRRNLWFQVVNTPLIALMICLYRHFLLSGSVEGNALSWGNYFETLAIVTFCAVALGVFWRFRFRNKYLAAKLVELQQLNERLDRLNAAASASGVEERCPAPSANATVTLEGSTSDAVTVETDGLQYIESVGNYVKVCHVVDGEVRRNTLRATSKQMEAALRDCATVVRCHRAFLVNLRQVEKAVPLPGGMQLLMKLSHDSIPVSRSNMPRVKEALRRM